MNYKLIAIDLSKQPAALHSIPKAIQRINFSRNLDQGKNETMSFILDEVKRNYFTFFIRKSKSFVNVSQKLIFL